MLKVTKQTKINMRILTAVIILFTLAALALPVSAIIDSQWDFELDTVNSQPQDVSITLNGVNINATVTNITSNSGNNSLFVNDSNSTSGITPNINFQSTRNIVNGSVVFAINSTTQTATFFIPFKDHAGTTGVSLSFNNALDKIQFFNGTGWTTITSYPINAWNTIQVDFNSVNHSFNFTMNGTLLGTGLAFNAPAVDFQRMNINDCCTATPLYYLDDIVIHDNSVPDLPNTTRKFPYPFRSAWSLSSDIDSLVASRQYDAYDFLNTNKNISGNIGVNLESSQNYWVFPDATDFELSYFKNEFSPTLSVNNLIFLDCVNTGFCDGFHNFQNVPPMNMSTAANISLLNTFFSAVNSTTYWVNHGGDSVDTNIGNYTSWQGDNPSNTTAYHWNRTSANEPIRYFWENATDTGGFNGGGVDDAFVNYPIYNYTLEDGTKIFTFKRVFGRTDYFATPHNDNFSVQINDTNLQKLIRRQGYAILYTHLGIYDNASNSTNFIFDANAITNLNNLANYFYGTGGKSQQIYVTTVAKLLRYAEVSEYLNYTYNSTSHVITINAVNDSVRNFVPTIADLEGITFINVSSSSTVFIGATNVTSSTVVNPDGSIMFPLKRLSYPYPNISSVGSYSVDTNGTVLWNRSSTRPALSQAVPLTVLPSSDSVNITINSCSATDVNIGVSSNTHNNPTTFTLTGCGAGFPANTKIFVTATNGFAQELVSDSNGQVSFTYTGGYSTITFDFSTFITTSNLKETYYSSAEIMYSLVLLLIIAWLGFIAVSFIYAMKDGKMPDFSIIITVSVAIGLIVAILLITVNISNTAASLTHITEILTSTR